MLARTAGTESNDSGANPTTGKSSAAIKVPTYNDSGANPTTGKSSTGSGKDTRSIQHTRALENDDELFRIWQALHSANNSAASSDTSSSYSGSYRVVIVAVVPEVVAVLRRTKRQPLLWAPWPGGPASNCPLTCVLGENMCSS